MVTIRNPVDESVVVIVITRGPQAETGYATENDGKVMRYFMQCYNKCYTCRHIQTPLNMDPSLKPGAH